MEKVAAMLGVPAPTCVSPPCESRSEQPCKVSRQVNTTLHRTKCTLYLSLCQVFILYHILFIWNKNIFSTEKGYVSIASYLSQEVSLELWRSGRGLPPAMTVRWYLGSIASSRVRPYLDSPTSNNLLRSLSVIPKARMTTALTANSIMACIKSIALKLKP
jgi:hypothetical protein